MKKIVKVLSIIFIIMPSSFEARQLGDNSFYHECKYYSPADEPGAKPSPKILYTIGFMNQTFSVGTLKLSDVSTSKNYAEGYFYHKGGTSNKFTFYNNTLYIENLDKNGQLEFIATYKCSQ